MPTQDRTTINAVIDALVVNLRAALVGDPPAAANPLRRVVIGDLGGTELPRPSMAVSIKKMQLLGVVDDDKVISVVLRLRIITDLTDANPHAGLLGITGAVDDCLDQILEVGVLEGACGFDRRHWTFDYPAQTTGVRLGKAEAEETFVVKVEREHNRVAAP